MTKQRGQSLFKRVINTNLSELMCTLIFYANHVIARVYEKWLNLVSFLLRTRHLNLVQSRLIHLVFWSTYPNMHQTRRKTATSYPFFYLTMIALGVACISALVILIRKRRVYLPAHVKRTNAYLDMAPQVVAERHSWWFDQRPSRRIENESGLYYSMIQKPVPWPSLACIRQANHRVDQ